jgi:glycosyltransferase involved in cell wall biosynthesis
VKGDGVSGGAQRENPVVSVVMSVYNGERYLAQAVSSILAQTYRDLELIVVNDGSTDGSTAILDTFDDPRIVRVNQPNRGLATALNVGIELARGPFLARHDADDLSEPHRLERQMAFLCGRPDVALLGSNYRVIDSEGRVTATTNVFTHPDDLRIAQIASNQFGHGAVVMRTELVRDIGGYDRRYRSACDAELWCRIGRGHRIANLKEPLYSWRDAGSGLSTTRHGSEQTDAEVREIRIREFDRAVRSGSLQWFSFHPRTVRGGVRAYLLMKATTYRDLSLLAAYTDRRSLSLRLALLAAAHAPWMKRTVRQIATVALRPSKVTDLPYEFI